MRRRIGNVIDASQPGYPSVRLTLDHASRVAAAAYAVDAPDGRGRVDQHITFDGRLASGVDWFRHMTITQDGRPYFTLAIERFSAIVE